MRGDVRVPAHLARVVLYTFGRLDVVVANAGVFSSAPSLELAPAMWDDCIAVNLTGVWNTYYATLPAIRSGNRGGSIITSPRVWPETDTQRGPLHGGETCVTGLMYGLARDLAPERICVIHPTTVDTPMVHNEALYRLFTPDEEADGREELTKWSATTHLIPTPWVTPDDIAHAAVFPASDESRLITGCALPFDVGSLLR